MKSRRWAMVVLTGVFAFGVTACGGANSVTSSTKADTKGETKSNYPEKPITITVPSGAGGGIDTAARSLAKIMDKNKLVSKAVTVENRPGGGQVVGTVEFTTKAKGNNYELLLPSTNLILNYLKKDGNSPVSYRDMTPLAQLVTDYDVLAVRPDSKYKDLKSLFEALKADPKSVAVAGGSAPGSFDHLNIILPAVKAGVNAKEIKYVSFDGGGQAITALLGGNVEVLSSDVSSVTEYVKAGKARILGVSSAKRLPEEKFKDIPTYKEQGIDAELVNWRGVFGPKDMSADAKAYWEEKIKTMVATEDWKNELTAQGWQEGYLNSADFVKSMEKQEADFKQIYTTLGMAK